MQNHPLLTTVQFSMQQRRVEIIPDNFILDALAKIDKGEVAVKRYPTGAPTMIGIYEIAHQLFTVSKN